MLNIYLREQVIKHSKNIKMYSQNIKMSSGFFMLSPRFVIAEYALSYQNTTRNSRLTFMSIIMKP